MELLLSESEEQDELKVMTLWETKEAFDGWVNSDSFKQAHAGRGKPASAEGAPAHAAGEGGRPASSEERPVMLGAKLSIHEVLFEQRAEAPVQSEN
ncbi:Heme oxygenase (staphylobilin-producing) 2 [compost metagenome]